MRKRAVRTRFRRATPAILICVGALTIGDLWPGQKNSERSTQEGKPNRLVDESSPYLQQHAHNPVDWYPWGPEAFERAEKEQKPIFLSVGYSTCHWCHVMERESFSSDRIAEYLNQHFISIKVDREERPDIDRVYMSFVQASTGGGGWPMNVFLTPDRKPFFGGTYFPPEARGDLPGFLQVLERVQSQWTTNRARITSAADRITKALRDRQSKPPAAAVPLDAELLTRAFRTLESVFDKKWGGFGAAPKFPRPVVFSFLLRYHVRSRDPRPLEMSTRTLQHMGRGGMHDQIGGGFHRYSTDERWFLPHFEKMLYDQAQLAIAYSRAYSLTRDTSLKRFAEGIFDYVRRDMTGLQGGFFSAEDADSSVSHDQLDEHAEGAFYVWTRAEIDRLLGADSDVFAHSYGVAEAGNVEKDPFREFAGKNVLYQARDRSETSRRFGLDPADVEARLSRSRRILFDQRVKRPRPFLDDKILTSWNGLMISAFARGYESLADPTYLLAARRAAVFVENRLYDSTTRRLKRRFRDGESDVNGLLDDYVFFAQGVLDLYEASLEERWLALAIDLTETQIALFGDSVNGGFFNNDGRDESVLFRIKEDYDGAEPSPNSVAVMNLLRLSDMTGRTEWRALALRTLRAFEGTLTLTPRALPQMLAALDFQLSKPRQIIITGDAQAPDTQAILKEVHSRYIPNRIVLLADGGALHRRLSERLEILKSVRRIEGKATAYICHDYVCDLPTNDPGKVAQLLDAGK